MPNHRVHLQWSFSRAVTAVPGTDEAEVLIDLTPSAFFGAPKSCQRPYTFHLTPTQARQLAIQLMREAQEASELDRQKKSP